MLISSSLTWTCPLILQHSVENCTKKISILLILLLWVLHASLCNFQISNITNKSNKLKLHLHTCSFILFAWPLHGGFNNIPLESVSEVKNWLKIYISAPAHFFFAWPLRGRFNNIPLESVSEVKYSI